MLTPETYPILIAALAFLTILLLCFGVIGLLGGAGNVERLKNRMASGMGRATKERTSGETLREIGRGLTGMFQNIGAKMGPKDESEISKTRRRLILAGIRSHNAQMVFQGSKIALTLCLAGSFLLVRFTIGVGWSLQLTMFATVALACIGCYAPDLWLRGKVKRRTRAIENELPDALDLLVVCVESGMGLDQALHRVGRELRLSAPVLSHELNLLTLELRAGKHRQEALRALTERIALDDLNSLVTLLIQADVFGISVARTLRVYSETLRTKRFQRAEELAAKLPVKLLIPLVLCILPALFVVIMGPAGIMLGETFAKMPK